ncbi:MAG: hypothetical protein WD397_07120 [Wenzhouxiangellaceae bacterium]
MKQIDRLRIGLTVLTTLAIWSLLFWQHFHGGVPAHHLLHNPDLPRVSDWFGGLLLPVLTWWLLSLSRRRMMAADSPVFKPVIVGMVAGLAFGLAMAISFLSGYESITSYLFFSLLPLALFLPVYRPECLLGFVLGMSMAFGVVLPTVFGSLMALATFLIHRFIGLPVMRRATGRTDT